MLRLATMFGILCFAVHAVGPVFAVMPYNVTDLGTLGGSAICPYDINNVGQVVGSDTTESGAMHAFLYHDGTMADLGVLPGASYSAARGINDDGYVVGYSNASGGGNHGFLYDDADGSMVDLGDPPGAYEKCVATDISSNGLITGYIYINETNFAHGFVYNDGTMTDIGRPPGSYSGALPCSINAAGEVSGYVYTSGAYERPFFYSDGQWTVLGTLGGERARATCMNENGAVVGWSWTGSGSHPFLYEDGTMTDLGVVEGSTATVAEGINIDGEIVGMCAQSGIFHACLYSDGCWSDLNAAIDPASGWELTEAIAINDSGWIIGLGTYNGATRAFLLTPIPEPTALALFGIGTVSLLAFARRCRR